MTPHRSLDLSTLVRSGASIAAATSATMALASYARHGSPWAGFDAMASIVVGGGRRRLRRFDAIRTPLGVAMLFGGLVVWGVAYDVALSLTGRRSTVVTGAASGLGGFLFDRYVLRRGLVDRFADAMGLIGAVAKYVTLGVASARFGVGAARDANATTTNGATAEQQGPTFDELLAAPNVGAAPHSSGGYSTGTGSGGTSGSAGVNAR